MKPDSKDYLDRLEEENNRLRDEMNRSAITAEETIRDKQSQYNIDVEKVIP